MYLKFHCVSRYGKATQEIPGKILQYYVSKWILGMAGTDCCLSGMPGIEQIHRTVHILTS